MTRALACGALAAAALVALPSLAPAAPKKRTPRLVVTAISAPAGALDPANTFTLSGRVNNRGRRASRALVSVALRVDGRSHTIAAGNLRSIRPRRARRFRLTARLPQGFQATPGRRYVLTACVRTRRGVAPRCRRSKRRVVFGFSPTPRPDPTLPAPPPPPQSEPPPPTAISGARSLGDRLFPEIGNGGYDATHYDLDLDYQPQPIPLLAGNARIDAVATEHLRDFSLDFVGLDVAAVTVDGKEAAFDQPGGTSKLLVTPAAAIEPGRSFTTFVTYGGTIEAYTDPDGSNEGWVPTEDGAFVVNEPVGAMSWYPNNNVPFDKATYDIKVAVPTGSTVFGNGKLVAQEGSSWHWREDSPMASYLTTATNGLFQRTTTTHTDGVQYEYGFAPTTPPTDRMTVQRSAEFSDWIADTFDVPYPFTSSGGVVDLAPTVGYHLESQTRPMYAAPPGATTVVHEIAHQWFGNSVSPRTWSDIWLNEGPARFVEWLWSERANGSATTTAQQFESNYNNASMDWSTPPAAPPDASKLFDTAAMYTRGAMVMEAVRQILGEPVFLAMCKEWLVSHAYGAATTAEFIALVKAHAPAGTDLAKLDQFFQQWLYTSYTEDGAKPDLTPDDF